MFEQSHRQGGELDDEDGQCDSGKKPEPETDERFEQDQKEGKPRAETQGIEKTRNVQKRLGRPEREEHRGQCPD